MIRSILVVILLTTSATAHSASNYSARIDYAGIFAVHEASERFESVQATQQIPAALGQVFGIYYAAYGKRPGQSVVIKEVIRRGDRQESETQRLITGAGNILAFGFDEPEEMVLGEWSFEVWQGPNRLAVQTFEVAEGDRISTAHTDGIVTSVCRKVTPTGSNRRVMLCEPPPPQ